MKRSACLTVALFALFFLAGCGSLPLPKERETAPIPSPTQYHITAELDAAEHTLSVLTDIDWSCPADDLSAVKFYLYPNAYKEGHEVVTKDKVEAAYPGGSPSYGGSEILSALCDVPVTDTSIGEDDMVLTLRLSRDLKKGERVRFRITQKVTLACIKHRLGYAEGYYYLSGFYPVVCPFSEGVFLTYPYTPFGDPFRLETAEFSLDLSLPIGTACAASAEIVRREAQGSTEIYSIASNSSREVAVVASKKMFVEKRSYGDKSLFYYYESGSNKERILSVIEDALRYYEECFGAYPYSTYTVVSAPFFESGVEHAGLTVISKDLSFAYKKKTILHETAHQWWFGKVGNDEFASPWIDEGLAEYSAAAYYKAAGQEAVYRELVREAEDAYAVRLSVKGSEGVRFDLPLPELSDGYYDRVYAGGLLLFSTLAERFGTERFHAALRDFAERYAGKVATQGALISSLSQSLEEDLSAFFQGWLTGVVPLQ